MIITGSVITLGGGGFVLGVTAGGMADAFLLGMAGAIAVTIVSAFVGGIRWLVAIDTKVDALTAALEVVECELTANGGKSAKDAIDRIDRRSRQLAETVGAIDYDDETNT